MTVEAAALHYDEQGLLPVVVQDVSTGAVLMLGFADREAVEKTLSAGEVHFWSRSRKALWRKGETSGNTLEVREVVADCDQDALLVRAHPSGPTCHRGTRSCFEPNPVELELGWLWQVLEGRRGADPASSYTARLLTEGVERIAGKVGEEATETVVAGLRAESDADRAHVVAEAADLLYHLLVFLLALGVAPSAVAGELERRHREKGAQSGGDETGGGRR